MTDVLVVAELLEAHRNEAIRPVPVKTVAQQALCSLHRIRAEGYTVLIVEQNVRQVLQVVDRAYLLETGRIKASGEAAKLLGDAEIRKAYLGL